MADGVRVNSLRGWRKVVLYPAVLFLRLFVSTLRLRPTERMKQLLKTHNHAAIMVFWHQNLFLMWKLNALLKYTLPMYGLISPSVDGAWLSALFSLLGIGSIRGSSGRRGTSALGELQEKLQRGANVAITPDGPRGPAKKFKNGVAVLALRTKADVFLFAIKYGSFWALNSWDRFRIPKPFSRVDIDYRKVSHGDIQHLSPKGINLLFERELESMWPPSNGND